MPGFSPVSATLIGNHSADDKLDQVDASARAAARKAYKGYLDAEKLEAQLVFEATLPEADYAPYKKWLAGQSILGALRIQVPNPFAK